MSISPSELMITIGTNYVESTSWSPVERILEERPYTLRTLSMDRSTDYTSDPSEARLTTLRIPSTIEELVRLSLRELVLSSLKELGSPVLDVEIRYGEGIGLYALAILDCDAHQALEYWLKIVNRTREYGIPTFVMWTGDVDITPEEMGTYIGKMLARMDVFLATKKPLDIVKILREEWGL